MTGACCELRISNSVLRGSSASETFGVRITPLASGDEDREEIWSQSRRILQLQYGPQLDSCIAAVRNFILAMGGPAQTFCVADPTDQGPGATRALWYDLADVTAAQRSLWSVEGGIAMPLFRGYEIGVHRRYRRVTKPRPAGFRVWWNDAEWTDDVTVDFGRGVVTFPWLPTAGRLYFAGRYDLCVRIDGDFTASGVFDDVVAAEPVRFIEVLGEADYTPATETDGYLAALGRSEAELSAVISDFQSLVSA